MGQNGSKNQHPSAIVVRNQPLQSRKNEARGLLKNCFRTMLFSIVPFEIWKDIVCYADAKSILKLSQTCWGFRALLEIVRDLYFEIALRYRREDQIPLALKCLQRCADCGNTLAMFHLGYACMDGGWGLKQDVKQAAGWLKKAARGGNAAGMAFFAHYLKDGCGVEKDMDQSAVWAQKALSSNNSFAVGYCSRFGLRTSPDMGKAFSLFEVSAKEGDEFGQFWLGCCYMSDEIGRNCGKSLYWFIKSAENGLAVSQRFVGLMYREGVGCEKNNEMAVIWFKKAANQANACALSGMNNLK